MAEFPIMPICTDSYLADTKHLKPEEHGVYLQLLIIAWRTADCSLDDDDERLAIMVGVTKKRWIERLRPVMERFFTVVNGKWTQGKQQKVRMNVANRVEQNRLSGSKGGQAKALKANNTTLANATPPLERNCSNQNQTPKNTESHSNSESKTPNTESHSHLRPSRDGPQAGIADQMVEIWNEVVGEALPKARPGAKSRRPKLTTALRRDLDGSLDQWRDACHRIAASSFLTGATGWTACGIDWVIKAENMTKILEGNYDDKKPNGNGANGHEREKSADVFERIRRQRGLGGRMPIDDRKIVELNATPEQPRQRQNGNHPGVDGSPGRKVGPIVEGEYSLCDDDPDSWRDLVSGRGGV